ncbi:MAG TPA: hypothetical protein VGK23_07150 [Methanomassiliicoccales archaeon]|jgi:hypothetical protein
MPQSCDLKDTEPIFREISKYLGRSFTSHDGKRMFDHRLNALGRVLRLLT